MQDTTVLDASLEKLYAEKEPKKILDIFKELVAALPKLNIRDNLKLSIFHHFCIVADKLEKDPETTAQIVEVLLKAGADDGKGPKTGLFVMGSWGQKTEEKKEEGKDSEQLKLMAEDTWGETALHYLAKRKLVKTLEVVLRTVVKAGEESRLNVNAKNGRGETFIHVLLGHKKTLYVYKFLSEFMKNFHFDIDSENEEKQVKKIKTILSEDLNFLLHDALNKLEKERDDAIKLIKEIFEVNLQYPEVFPLTVFLKYEQLKISFIHSVCKKGDLDILKLLLGQLEKLDLLKMILDIDTNSGNTILHYVCQECVFGVCSELIQLYMKREELHKIELSSQNKLGNTCLHCVAYNRKMNIMEKSKLIKSLLEIAPKMCNISNLEGHKPLTLYIVALNNPKLSPEIQDEIKKIIMMIQANTNMKQWKKNANEVFVENAKRVEELTLRAKNSQNSLLRINEKLAAVGKKPKELKKKKEYLAKYVKWERQRKQKNAICGVISPVEAAIIANNTALLQTCLVDWDLDGNIIMNSGRHVLNYAIDNCNLAIIELLLNKGNLKRFMNLNRKEAEDNKDLWYNLDGIIIHAWASLMHYYKYNLINQPIKFDDCPQLVEYKDYSIKENISRTCANFATLNPLKGVSIYLENPSSKFKFDSQVLKQIEELKSITGLYLKEIIKKQSKIEGSDWINFLEGKSYQRLEVFSGSIYPLESISYLLESVCKIKDLNELSMEYFSYLNEEQINSTVPMMTSSILSNGNETLIKMLLESPRTSNLVDMKLKEILGDGDSLPDLFFAITKTFADPTPILNYLNSIIPCTKWQLKSNCRSKNFRRKTEIEYWLCKHIGKDLQLENVKSIFMSLMDSPIVLSHFIQCAPKAPEEVNEEQENAFIKSIVKSIGKMMRLKQCRLMNELLEFLYNYLDSYFTNYFKSIHSLFTPSSPEFLFYFVILKKYLSKSENFDKSKQMTAFLTEPNINALKHYAKLMKEIYRSLCSEIYRNNMLDSNDCFKSHNNQLLKLFGLLHLNNYNHTVIWQNSEKEGEEVIKEMLKHLVTLPFVAYYMFQRKKSLKHYNIWNRGNRVKYKFINAINYLNLCSELLGIRRAQLVLEVVPLVKPRILIKIAENECCEMKIQESAIYSHIALMNKYINQDSGFGKAIEFVFEQKMLKSMEKSTISSERHYRKILLDEYKSHHYSSLHAALIDMKYGFVLSYLVRKTPAVLHEKLIKDFNLQQTLFAIELMDPNTYSDEVKRPLHVARKNYHKGNCLVTFKYDPDTVLGEATGDLLRKERKSTLKNYPRPWAGKKAKMRDFNKKKEQKKEAKVRMKRVEEKEEKGSKKGKKIIPRKKRKANIKETKMRKPKQAIYFKQLRYIVTCPLLERLKVNWHKDDKEEQKLILGFSETIRKNFGDSILFVLANCNMLTNEIFKQYYSMRESSKLFFNISMIDINKIICSVLTNGIEFNQMISILCYLKSISKDYPSDCMSLWCEHAIVTRNSQLFIKLCALKAFLERGQGKSVKYYGDYHHESLSGLFNMRTGDFCQCLTGRPELTEFWNYIFSTSSEDLSLLVATFPRYSGFFLTSSDKIASIIVYHSPELWIKFIDFIPKLKVSYEKSPFQMLEKTLDRLCKDYSANISNRYALPFISNETFAKNIEVKEKSTIKPPPEICFDSKKEGTSSADIHFWLLHKGVYEAHQDLDTILSEISEKALEILKANWDKNLFYIFTSLIHLNHPYLSPLIMEYSKIEAEDNEANDIDGLINTYLNISNHKTLNTLPLLTKLIRKAKFKGSLIAKKIDLAYEKLHKLPFAEVWVHTIISNINPGIVKSNLVIRSLLYLSIMIGSKLCVNEWIKRFKDWIEETKFQTFVKYSTEALICYPPYATIKSPKYSLDILIPILQAYPSYSNAMYTLTSTTNLPLKALVGTAFKRFSNETISLLEIALFYRRFDAVSHLLTLTHYTKYAQEKADQFIEFSLLSGSLSHCKNFMKIASKTLDPSYLIMAARISSIAICTDILKELKGNFSNEEILNCKNAAGETLLHIIAKVGQRDLLQVCSKIELINLMKIEKTYLRAINNEHLTPFALAIQAENYDIAGLLYPQYENISEISEEELLVISSPCSILKALTEVTEPATHTSQFAIWKLLLPKLKENLDLIKKLGGDSESRSKRKAASNLLEQNNVDTLSNFFKRGMLSPAFSLMIFRRDILEVATLMEEKFKLKEKIFSSILGTKALRPLMEVFIQLGIGPSNTEEILQLLTKNKSLDDESCLLMMQMIRLFEKNSPESNNNMNTASDEKLKELLMHPYFYMMNRADVTIGTNGTKFSFDEFSCLYKPQNPKSLKQKEQYYNVDFAVLAEYFLKSDWIRSFSLIMLYAQQFDSALLSRIIEKINKEELIQVILNEQPHELSWILETGILKKQNGLVLNLKDKSWYLGETENKIHLNPSTKALSGLLFLITHFPGESVIVKNENEEIINDPQLVFDVVFKYILQEMICVYKDLDKFEKHLIEGGEEEEKAPDAMPMQKKEEEEKKESKKKKKVGSGPKTKSAPRPGLADVKRQIDLVRQLLDGWRKIEEENTSKIGKDLGIFKMQNSIIDVKTVARQLSILLNPENVELEINSGIISLIVNPDEVLNHAQECLSKEMNLPQAVAYLYSGDLIMGFIEIPDTAEKHVMNLRVSFASGESSAPIEYKLQSVDLSSTLRMNRICLNRKLLKPEKREGIVISAEMILNTKKRAEISKTREKANEEFNSEIIIETFNKDTPFKGSDIINDKLNFLDLKLDENSHALLSDIQFHIDPESIKKNLKYIQQLYYNDIHSRMISIAKRELLLLFEDLSSSGRNCGELLKIIPANVTDYPSQVRDIISLAINCIPPTEPYQIVFMTDQEFQEASGKLMPIKERIIDSLHQCTKKLALDISHHQIVILLPTDPSLKSPEKWLIPETFICFPAYRVISAENRCIKKCGQMIRATAPFMRINCIQFIENIAVPLCKILEKGNSKISENQHLRRFTHPLLVLEEFFEFSLVFSSLIKRLISQLDDLQQRYQHDMKTVLINFEISPKKRALTKMDYYPVIDQLIRVTGVKFKSDRMALSMSLEVESLEVSASAIDQLKLEKLPMDATANAEYVTYMTTLCNEMKILESLFAEVTLLEKLLEREKGTLSEIELSKQLTKMLGKSVTVRVDWQSIYCILQDKLKKIKEDSKDEGEYCKKKGEFYKQIQTLTREANPKKIKDIIGERLSPELDEIFLAFARSDARRCMFEKPEMKNFAMLQLNPNGIKDAPVPNECEKLYEITRVLKVGGGTGLDYGCYTKVNKDFVKANLAAIKNLKCIMDVGKASLKSGKILDFKDGKFIFKLDSGVVDRYPENGGRGHDAAQTTFFYIALTPELEALPEVSGKEGVVFMADCCNGGLWKISKENHNALKKLIDAGQFIDKIMPSEFMLRFYPDSVKENPSSEESKEAKTSEGVEIPMKMMFSNTSFSMLPFSLKSGIPKRMLFFGKDNFKQIFTNFRDSFVALMKEYKQDTAFSPLLALDLEALNHIPETLYSQVLRTLSYTFDTILVSLKSILSLTCIPQLSRLTESLDANFDPNANNVESIYIAKILFQFLSQNPITIKLQGSTPITPTEESDIKYVYLDQDKRRFNVLFVVKFDKWEEPLQADSKEDISSKSKTAIFVSNKLQHYLPLKYHEIIADELIKQLCLLELKKLAEAMENPNKLEGINLEKLENDPLRLSYNDGIALLNIACGRDSQAVKITNQTTLNNMHQLRLILAMPNLMKNISSALALAKELKLCPKINLISLLLKEGSAITPDHSNIEYQTASSTLQLTLFTYSMSTLLIPTTNQILETIFKCMIKVSPGKQEGIIENMKCALLTAANKIGFAFPVIFNNSESVNQVYTFFHAEPMKPIDLEANGLQDLINCGLIRMNDSNPRGITVITSISGCNLKVSYKLPGISGLYKLVIRLANRIVYSKILICYSLDELPKFLKAEPEGRIQLFASTEEGLLGYFGKGRKLFKEEKHTIGSYNDTCSLQFMSRGVIDKFYSSRITENLIYWSIKFSKDYNPTDKSTFFCFDLTHDRLCWLVRNLSEVGQKDYETTAIDIKNNVPAAQDKEIEKLVGYCVIIRKSEPGSGS